jgi:hypothetical protein
MPALTPSAIVLQSSMHPASISSVTLPLQTIGFWTFLIGRTRQM